MRESEPRSDLGARLRCLRFIEDNYGGKCEIQIRWSESSQKFQMWIFDEFDEFRRILSSSKNLRWEFSSRKCDQGVDPQFFGTLSEWVSKPSRRFRLILWLRSSHSVFKNEDAVSKPSKKFKHRSKIDQQNLFCHLLNAPLASPNDFLCASGF